MSGEPLDLTPRPRLYPVSLVDPEPRAGSPSAGAARVAVIMRTKDRPLLLHRALSSVLLQSNPAWHLYLVNDGGDAPAVDELLERYDRLLAGRLTVIHHAQSLGMERASNSALARATEEFIIVHDDDDAWHPEFLAEAVSFLDAPDGHDFVGVTTACHLVKERIVQGVVVEVERELWAYNRGIVDLRKLLAANPFPPICLLFRRSAVARIGGFNGDLRVLGDWEFNLRLLMVGDIGFIDRTLAYYHIRLPAGSQPDAYSNTVVDFTGTHEAQNIRLRNATIRAALASHPELIGVLQPIVHGMHDMMRNLEQDVIPAMEKRLLVEIRRKTSYQADLDKLWKFLQRVTRPARQAWGRYRAK